MIIDKMINIAAYRYIIKNILPNLLNIIEFGYIFVIN